jgi:hypothetical protein
MAKTDVTKVESESDATKSMKSPNKFDATKFSWYLVEIYCIKFRECCSVGRDILYILHNKKKFTYSV